MPCASGGRSKQVRSVSVQRPGFPRASLRELPPHLAEQAFDRVGALRCVRPKHREGIEFLCQDLRREMPALRFDLVLCRYVAFTYFAEPLQRQVLAGIMDRLSPYGYLVIGTHEHLPSVEPALMPLSGAPQILHAPPRRSPLLD